MKKILAGMMFTIASMQSAGAVEVGHLDCVASNGVVLKGTIGKDNILLVGTQWGVFHKEFFATLSASTTTEATVINLSTKENGTEYQLALDASPNQARTQNSTGTLLKAAALPGLQPTLVAYVSCQLRFR